MHSLPDHFQSDKFSAKELYHPTLKSLRTADCLSAAEAKTNINELLPPGSRVSPASLQRLESKSLRELSHSKADLVATIPAAYGIATTGLYRELVDSGSGSPTEELFGPLSHRNWSHSIVRQLVMVCPASPQRIQAWLPPSVQLARPVVLLQVQQLLGGPSRSFRDLTVTVPTQKNGMPYMYVVAIFADCPRTNAEVLLSRGTRTHLASISRPSRSEILVHVDGIPLLHYYTPNNVEASNGRDHEIDVENQAILTRRRILAPDGIGTAIDELISTQLALSPNDESTSRIISGNLTCFTNAFADAFGIQNGRTRAIYRKSLRATFGPGRQVCNLIRQSE